MKGRLLLALGGGLLMGLAGIASAEQTSDAELTALKARVAELEARQNADLLDQKRAEQTKQLIREVLADADTRASLLQDGMTAGHNGKNFFLASEDGSFLLTVGGQIQFRYLASFNNYDGVNDGEEEGFQVRRTKLKFGGHIADPKLKYEIVLEGDRGNGNVSVEDVYFSYQLMDGVAIKAGKFKLPFLREELTSSTRQLAVDRGIATEYFTLDRSEQVQLIFDLGDSAKAMWTVASDGADEEFSTLGADPVEWATTVRVDLKLMGDWGQAKDFSAWSGEETAAFLGGAFYYQIGDGQNADNSSESEADYLAWTVDGSLETAGLGLYAAIMGGHVNVDTGGDSDGSTPTVRDMYGVLVQGGYMVIPDVLEPFVRWEWIDGDIDGVSDDNLQALTFGVNWYHKKHDAKFTADIVYVYDAGRIGSNAYGNAANSDGLGLNQLSTFAEDAFVALRLQYQLLF